MKKYLILITLFFLSVIASAQQTPSELVKELNKQITLYSADNASLFTLYETTGTLEQKLNDNSIQRILLREIAHIKAEANAETYTVVVKCADSSHCINLIKNDKAGTSIPSNAFFFTEAKAANSFAKIVEELIVRYSSTQKVVKAELLNNLNSNSKITQEIVKEKPKEFLKQKDAEKEEDVDDEDQLASPKEKNTKKKKQIEKEENDETPNEMPSNRRGFPQKEENLTDDVTAQVCKQLNQIIDAGKKSSFKEIEGKESNPTKKINESKIKLKGAKRSYLSWYKKERAFIAEYKTSSDNELILIEFERIQTELEDCLEAGWDDTDRSHDEIYSNAAYDIKDVEYTFSADASMPTLRIMINADETKKYTLFIRIQ